MAPTRLAPTRRAHTLGARWSVALLALAAGLVLGVATSPSIVVPAPGQTLAGVATSPSLGGWS